MTVRLDGKVALVTGGISGIGLGIARTLMERGASVVAMARREEAGREVEAGFTAGGQPFAFVRGDVVSADDCERVVAQALAAHGKIDVLINNAATTLPTPDIEHVTEAEWDRALDPNLKGAFLMTRAVLPHMKARGDGAIINIASFAGCRACSTTGPTAPPRPA
jgi:NAD(P)-dependent dehydrogenase (short-subunit alcohol dehydrogenase family)